MSNDFNPATTHPASIVLKCSLCGAQGTNKSTCPLNPNAKHPDPKKHRSSPVKPAAVKLKSMKVRARPEAVQMVHPRPASSTPSPSTPSPSTPSPSTPSPSTPTTQIQLSEAYLDIASRLKLKDRFQSIVDDKPINKCTFESFTLQKRLGHGSFGIVHSAIVGGNQPFAVKKARVTGDALKTPWSDKTAWTEVLILRDIVNPIVSKGLSPNLPLLYGAHVCATCEFEGLNTEKGGKSKKAIKPCLIMFTELAGGDLANWLTAKPSEAEIYNALFQILAGIYALQKYGQVFNNDMKAPNILYYNVKPGGFWDYTIMGKHHRIPNLGKLFIINDFGVSSSFSPDFMYSYEEEKNMYSLGRRTFIVDASSSPPTLLPLWTQSEEPRGSPADINLYQRALEGTKHTITAVRRVLLSSKKKLLNIKANLTPKQEAILRSNGIPTDAMNPAFYSNIDIMPPQEFAADVIDALSMFVGGINRATQDGKHHDYGIPESVKKTLLKYIPKTTDNKHIDTLYYRDISKLHPATVHAGYLINDIFSKVK
jgi:serine/threonine protein kinase